MPKIFLSYRRQDSADTTGRIDDRLVAAFGRQNVFKDLDSIPRGADFRNHVRDAISKCDVVLVVIGGAWLSITEDGKRRLENEHDFVRIEVETALKREILVIPVLLANAHLPKPEELPESLRDLAYRNATRVRQDPDFHGDVGRIVHSIENEHFARPSRRRRNATVFILSLTLLVLAFVAFTFVNPKLKHDDSGSIQEVTVTRVSPIVDQPAVIRDSENSGLLSLYWIVVLSNNTEKDQSVIDYDVRLINTADPTNYTGLHQGLYAFNQVGGGLKVLRLPLVIESGHSTAVLVRLGVRMDRKAFSLVKSDFEGIEREPTSTLIGFLCANRIDMFGNPFSRVENGAFSLPAIEEIQEPEFDVTFTTARGGELHEVVSWYKHGLFRLNERKKERYLSMLDQGSLRFHKSFSPERILQSNATTVMSAAFSSLEAHLEILDLNAAELRQIRRENEHNEGMLVPAGLRRPYAISDQLKLVDIARLYDIEIDPKDVRYVRRFRNSRGKELTSFAIERNGKTQVLFSD